MKALLLAAGRATRLGVLSQAKPKCLHDVGGEALLDRLVRQLLQVGVGEILINTHHLSEQIYDHVSKASWASRASLVFEPELLGTLGALRTHGDFFDGGAGWLLHADNFICGSFEELRRAYDLRGPGVLGALLAFPVADPERYGVVSVDDDGMMTDFFEKTSDPPSSIASAATVVLDEVALAYARSLPDEMNDLSRDFLPRLRGRLSVVVHTGSIIDIGTPEGLERARAQAGDV
jgi:NDP-sugar pyrophosphorylase family protein